MSIVSQLKQVRQKQKSHISGILPSHREQLSYRVKDHTMVLIGVCQGEPNSQGRFNLMDSWYLTVVVGSVDNTTAQTTPFKKHLCQLCRLSMKDDLLHIMMVQYFLYI